MWYNPFYFSANELAISLNILLIVSLRSMLNVSFQLPGTHISIWTDSIWTEADSNATFFNVLVAPSLRLHKRPLAALNISCQCSKQTNEYKNQPGPLLRSDDSTVGHLSCPETAGAPSGQCGLQLLLVRDTYGIWWINLKHQCSNETQSCKKILIGIHTIHL